MRSPRKKQLPAIAVSIRKNLPKDISAWLHVGEDGIVTGFTGKAEIGQNIRTSLAQTIADELRVPFESVRMVTADTVLTPFDMGTFGSRTTPTITPQLRRVASAARDLLIEAAAKEWNIASAGLVAADAKVTDTASGRSLKYTELARGKTLAQNLPAEDPITPASQWTVAGKAVPKVEARAFVTGKHQYTPICIRKECCTAKCCARRRSAQHSSPVMTARLGP